MAVQETAQWWIRTDGNDLNGAGFDSGISGAGTNYCDQASPQLALTDCATSSSGDTQLTSVSGGFTSAMIGNAIRLTNGSSGANLTHGDYFITGYSSSNSVTLDRAPDNGGGGISGCTGNVGGAWASIEYTITTVATPCPKPQVSKNVINIRGSGTVNPTAVDYPFSTYRQFGSHSTYKPVLMRGYNGTPHIKRASGHLWHYASSGWAFENIKVTSGGGANHGFGLFEGPAFRCIADQNSYGGMGARYHAVECLFLNTGGGSTGTYGMFDPYTYGQNATRCVFKDSANSGGAIKLGNAISQAHGNLCINCKNGAVIWGNSGNYNQSLTNNTFIGDGTGTGINITAHYRFSNINSFNIISNYSVGIATPTTSGVDMPYAARMGTNQNALHNCTTNYTGLWQAGPDDKLLTADPFTDASAGDYSLNGTAGGGAEISGLNWLSNVSGYGNETSSASNWGAIQNSPVASSGGASSVVTGTQIYPFRHLVEGDFKDDPDMIPHPLYSN